MPGNFGGIGQQVADNIFELGQSAAKGVVRASVDIAKDTIENVVGAPSSVAAAQAGKKSEASPDAHKQQEIAGKRQAEKRQYENVKSELETYIQRKRQQDAQIAQEKERETKEKEQKEGYEKQKRDSFVQQLMKRISGSSHGETSKQKE